jgi:hypothetical protein
MRLLGSHIPVWPWKRNVLLTRAYARSTDLGAGCHQRQRRPQYRRHALELAPTSRSIGAVAEGLGQRPASPLHGGNPRRWAFWQAISFFLGSLPCLTPALDGEAVPQGSGETRSGPDTSGVWRFLHMVMMLRKI